MIRLLLVSILFFASSVFAVTLEDYAASKRVSLLAVSPSGDLIAFRKQQDNRDMILVYSLRESKSVAAYEATETTPRRLYFLNEKTLILVASDRMGLHGFVGRHDISVAYAIDLKSGKMNQLLTPGNRIYIGQTGIGKIVGTSPDDKFVYMPAYMSSRELDRTPNWSLFKVKVGKRSRPKIIEHGSFHTEDYFLDDSGNVLAQEVYDNSTNKHRLLARHGKKWVTIFEDEVAIPQIGFVGLTQDFKSILYSKESFKSDVVAYYEMRLSDGEVKGPLYAKAGKDVTGVFQNTNRTVTGIIYGGFSRTYEFFDPKTQKIYEAITQQFEHHTVRIEEATDDWSQVVAYVEGPSYSGDYFLFSNGKELRHLTAARPNITSDKIHPVGKVTFKARDGLKIPTLITIPGDKAANLKNLPTVVLPHGGPGSNDKLGFNWWAQALANEGYLVVQPQFRGSTGFGVKHYNAGDGEWGKKMQDDLDDAVDFFVKKGMADSSKVCIAGGSYGGYAALAAGAFSPEKYRCVIAVNAVTDLNVMLKKTKRAAGKRHWVVSYWEDIVADGDTSFDALAERSPAESADSFLAPVLLVHSTEDNVVPIQQARIMKKELTRKGKSVKLVKLKGENHYLEDEASKLALLKESVVFLKEHIGGE